MQEWKAFDVPIKVPIYTIVKVRNNKEQKKWEYTELETGIGDWEDLVVILWGAYDQFSDQVSDIESTKNRYNTLERISKTLERGDEPYDFTMPDGTDDWYHAYVRIVDVFYMDHSEGNILV